MGLAKQSDSNIIYLEVKYYSLWRALKKQVDGCDIEMPTNPRTGEKVTKYGYKYRSVTGRATKLIWYDTGDKFAQRYFGFKLTIVDQDDTFVLDMPWRSQILRRFMRLARNIDWAKPFTLTIFKGKKKEKAGSEDTGIWFQQFGESVKSYHTVETPRGMPIATQDAMSHDWDFKPQERWLAEKLKNEIAADIDAIAAASAPPIEPDHGEQQNGDHRDADEELMPPGAPITDDDVPF